MKPLTRKTPIVRNYGGRGAKKFWRYCFYGTALLLYGGLASAQIALPNLSLIGTNVGASATTLQMSKGDLLPKHIAVDLMPDGTIYGVLAEYRQADEVFDQLRSAIQKAVNLPPKRTTSNFLNWYVEDRKITINLFRDKGLAKVTVLSTFGASSNNGKSKKADNVNKDENPK